MGVWGKRGIKGGWKGGSSAAFWGGKGGVGAAFLGRKGGFGAAFCLWERRPGRRLFSYLDAEGGELAAAVVRCQRQLAGGHQRHEDSLDSAAAQANFPLQRELIDAPLAVSVGMVGNDDEDEELRAFVARAGEDGIDMLMTQGRHPAWRGRFRAPAAGCRARPDRPRGTTRPGW